MTLTHLVRLQLLAEFAAYLFVGAWLHRAHGWPVPSLVAAAAATGLAVRLAIVCTSSSIAWFARSPRSPEHQLGLAGTVRLVLGEWRAMLADNLWYLPFERQAMRADAAGHPADAIPVLMVHGYLSNRGLLHSLVGALEAAGVKGVRTFNFRCLFHPLDDYVAELELQATKVLGESGAPKLVLVCHSLGGLVARSWISRHGAARVAKLITIATPHHGTVLAKLGLGANALQMRRGCGFLGSLAAKEGATGPDCPVTSIYTVHDNLVAPQETSRLPWAKNVALHGVGHVEVLDFAPLHRAVLEELRGTGVAMPA